MQNTKEKYVQQVHFDSIYLLLKDEFGNMPSEIYLHDGRMGNNTTR